MTVDYWAALPPPLTGVHSHADHGEDVILKAMFDTMRVDRPSYLDVGAFDPLHISNTSILYRTGSRGINIEANPRLIGEFHRHRPYDLNLCCAVGPERLEARTLYIDENPGLSSFYRDHVGQLVDEIQVKTWTLPDILIGHRKGTWPDLLTVDIEGEDLAVLESCLPAEGDRPTVVVVEYLRLVQDYSAEWRKLMPERNYELFFKTRSNMIWTTKECREALL